MKLEPIHGVTTDSWVVFERLGVERSNEIWLEEIDATVLGGGSYLARSGSRRTYVDRHLAARLRAEGAAWCGDVARDPCAVA